MPVNKQHVQAREGKVRGIPWLGMHAYFKHFEYAIHSIAKLSGWLIR